MGPRYYMSLANNWNGNRVLGGLAPDNTARMTPHLRPERLELRQCLEATNRPISRVYFPLCGPTSVVALSANRRQETEVGVIGYEGMTG